MVSNADAGGGDHFKDWAELAKVRAVCAFRIKRVCDPETLTPGQPPAHPVIADVAVLFADQDNAGEWAGLVLRDEKIIKAGITGKLRTKRERVGARVKTMARQPGEDVCLAVAYYTDKRNKQQVGAEPCTDPEFERVVAAFDKYGQDPFTGLEREELAAAGMPVPGVQNADAGDSDELPF